MDKNQIKNKYTLTINLLNEEVARKISILAGTHSLTIGQLVENFIQDLIGGKYSNGSDEHDLAYQWFNRCWFGMFPEDSLLRHIINCGEHVDDFLTSLDEQEYYDSHPDEYLEDTKELHGAIMWHEEHIERITKAYLQDHPDAELKQEIKLCREWFNELQQLKEENKEWRTNDGQKTREK